MIVWRLLLLNNDCLYPICDIYFSTVITQKHTWCNPLAILDITPKAALCSEKKITLCHYPLSSKANFFIYLRFMYSLAESRSFLSLVCCLFVWVFVCLALLYITLYIPNPHNSSGGPFKGLKPLWVPLWRLSFIDGKELP